MALIANELPHRCEHPDGCLLQKHYRRHTLKSGEETIYYDKYCKSHGNRLGRYGELGAVEIRAKARNGDGSIVPMGYREFYTPHHPLASKNGKVFEHRMVLYDKLKASDAPCFWCAKMLVWGRTLCVDHMDFDKLNNDPANLVPSCSSCNVKRFNALIRYVINNKVVNNEVLSCLI